MSRFIDEDTLEDKLVSAVMKQMREDIQSGDTTCIFDLLYQVPADKLVNYLPEDQWEPFKRFLD